MDPYATLQVDPGATPLEIKKAYKKLSLKYHPDKITQTKAETAKDQFPQIQFAYSILSDPVKRKRYDTTGLLEETSEDFAWKEYFDQTTEKITIDMIEEDRAKYQNLEEERLDILSNFAYYDGDLLKLFEVIPHLEFDERLEGRVFEMIETGFQEGALEDQHLKLWEKYKKLRKTKVKQMLKKLAKEAKQAEEMSKKLKSKPKTEGDLRALIRKKNAGSLDNLISNLEAKYCKPGKKRHVDLGDDEFDRIQAKLKRKRN